MADRPIIFSAPMVRALLEGRKTQTRRIMRPPHGTFEMVNGEWRPIWLGHFPGDRLYVREHWRTWKDYDDESPSNMPPNYVPVFYEVDRDNCDRHGRHRQGMHMPRWASRLTLTVTDVRVQRVSAISGEDAVQEGVQSRLPDNGIAQAEFHDLWNNLHNKPGDRWEDNPWIYALTFTVEKRNIDA